MNELQIHSRDVLIKILQNHVSVERFHIPLISDLEKRKERIKCLSYWASMLHWLEIDLLEKIKP